MITTNTTDMNKKMVLLDFLNANHLHYQLYDHEPIFTVAEGKVLSHSISGAHSKNLFLKDKKNSFWLISVLEDKRVDLKALSTMYGKGRLSFASEEELFQKLKLTPGAVTPYALLHDTSHEV